MSLSRATPTAAHPADAPRQPRITAAVAIARRHPPLALRPVFAWHTAPAEKRRRRPPLRGSSSCLLFACAFERTGPRVVVRLVPAASTAHPHLRNLGLENQAFQAGGRDEREGDSGRRHPLGIWRLRGETRRTDSVRRVDCRGPAHYAV